MATLNSKIRGSDKLLNAWKARTLTEETVREIGKALDESPATVTGIIIVGGADATGMRVSLSYTGDEVPRCGNDIATWLTLLRKHGGTPFKPPRIIINGRPFPDEVLLELDYGNTLSLPAESAPNLELAMPGKVIG